MTYGVGAYEEKNNNRCLLYVILLAVIGNLLITGFLSYGLYVVATQGETHAKRISNEIIEERIQAFQTFLEVPENREFVVEETAKALSELARKVAPDVTKSFVQEAATNLVPYDVFSIADYLLTYNFQPTATLLANTLESVSMAFMKIPRYQEVGQALSAISAVVDIVSGVEPLSTSTAPPNTYDFSLLGQSILRLPVVLENSLTQSVWQQAANDCAILMNRLYFTDFTGTYNSIYGPTDFNFNSQVKPVFSNIYDVCLTLASAQPVSSS